MFNVNKEVVDLVKNRVELGQKRYGGNIPLNDGRDMIKESLEEILDSCVYIATELIKLRERVDRYESSNLIGKDY
tara:strand:+ start:135 stop:359 length:225 start_codon:yes stop_codon:yes gene_type:complete